VPEPPRQHEISPPTDTPRCAGVAVLDSVVERNSARMHHPELGYITAITTTTAPLPYTLHDLTKLLTTTNPEKLGLNQTHVPAGDNIAYVPNRSDVILRWNPAEDPLPQRPDELVRYMERYEKELGRLEASGVPMLGHNTYIVEHDKWLQRPCVYMPVERLADETPLSYTDIYIPAVQAVHRNTLNAVFQYLDETPPGEPFIFESTTDPDQFNAGGRLFDLDPYMSSSDKARAREIGYITTWAERLDAAQLQTEETQK